MKSVKPLVVLAMPLGLLAGPLMAAIVTSLVVATVVVNRVLAATG